MTAKRKRPSHVKQVMITQLLSADVWELVAGHERDAQWILDRIVEIVEAHGHKVRLAYAVIHDRDSHSLLDYLEPGPLFAVHTPGTPKAVHIHIILYIEPGVTVAELAQWLGLEARYIETAKPGPYGWDNMSSYLIHAHKPWAYQYDISDVVTARGPAYADLAKAHRLDWYNGLQAVNEANAKLLLPAIKDLARSGRIGADDLVSDEELYDVYSRLAIKDRREVDALVKLADKRRVLTQAGRLDAERIPTSVIYICGDPGSGKTYAARTLIRDLHDRCKWDCHEATPGHALEGYTGQEVILIDEMDARRWSLADLLRLLDPMARNSADARYTKLGPVAPHLIVITTSVPPHDLIWAMRGREEHPRPLDELMRRISLYVTAVGYGRDQDRPNEYTEHGYDVSEVILLDGGKPMTWPLPDGLPYSDYTHPAQLTSTRDYRYLGSIESPQALAGYLLGGPRQIAGSLPDGGRPICETGTGLETDRGKVRRQRAATDLTSRYGAKAARHMMHEHGQTDLKHATGWVPGCNTCATLKGTQRPAMPYDPSPDAPVDDTAWHKDSRAMGVEADGSEAR